VEDEFYELRYLRAYSPDLNPIEEAFAKIKAILRSAQARTCGTLIEAVGMAIPEVTPQHARGFFEHCGYRRATLPV
jgi:transposase